MSITKIAFIGFGVVGQGLAEQLLELKDELKINHGFEYQVVAISDKLKGSVYEEKGLDLQKLLDLVSTTGKIDGYPSGIKGWDSLKPYVTSYITGWKIFEINVPKDVTTSKVRHSDGLFKLLNNDRTDLVLYELLQGLKHIKENNYKEIKASFPPLAEKKMFPYLHKKHAHLVPKLTKALKEMKKDGTYDQIYQRVIGQLE